MTEKKPQATPEQIARAKDILKSFDAKSKSAIQIAANRVGVLTTDKFMAELSPALVAIHDAPGMDKLPPKDREEMTVSTFSGRHGVSNRLPRETIEVIMLDRDRERTSGEGAPVQSTFVLIPSLKMACTIFAKHDRNVKAMTQMKHFHKYLLEEAPINKSTQTIFATDDKTDFKFTDKGEVAMEEKVLLDCIKNYNLAQLREAVKGKGSYLGISTLFVQSVSPPNENGSYHTMFDNEILAALKPEEEFPGFSLWFPNRLKSYPEGSKLLVVYSCFAASDRPFPKGNALFVIPKFVAPSSIPQAPAGSRAEEAHPIDNMFEFGN